MVKILIKIWLKRMRLCKKLKDNHKEGQMCQNIQMEPIFYLIIYAIKIRELFKVILNQIYCGSRTKEASIKEKIFWKWSIRFKNQSV